MNGRAFSLGYEANEVVEVVRLPYKGNDVAMTLFLPRPGVPLSKVRPRFRNLPKRKVRVSLPKFKLEKAQELRPALESMGLVEAFDDQRANFALMSPEFLKIDKVLHKAFVKVDEKGSEAAVATVVTVSRGVSQPSPSIHFKADRPFLFTIDHLPSKTMLFLGRIENPEG